MVFMRMGIKNEKWMPNKKLSPTFSFQKSVWTPIQIHAELSFFLSFSFHYWKPNKAVIWSWIYKNKKEKKQLISFSGKNYIWLQLKPIEGFFFNWSAIEVQLKCGYLNCTSLIALQFICFLFFCVSGKKKKKQTIGDGWHFDGSYL